MDHAKSKPLRILCGPYLQLCCMAPKTSHFINYAVEPASALTMCYRLSELCGFVN